jgi:hypothetical protein
LDRRLDGPQSRSGRGGEENEMKIRKKKFKHCIISESEANQKKWLKHNEKEAAK